MGENEYGESGHLSIFTLLKHLMMLLKYNFSGLHFYTLPKTLIGCRDMQLRSFKVRTLLNNAFKKRKKQGGRNPLEVWIVCFLNDSLKNSHSYIWLPSRINSIMATFWFWRKKNSLMYIPFKLLLYQVYCSTTCRFYIPFFCMIHAPLIWKFLAWNTWIGKHGVLILHFHHKYQTWV